MNRLRYLTIAAVLTAVHLFLALSSLLVSFSLGMGRFDSGGDMSQLEGLATALSDTLLSPISHVQTKGLSSPLQWTLVFLETAFFGVLFLQWQYGHWRDWRGVNVLPSNNAFERTVKHRGPASDRGTAVVAARPKLGRWQQHENVL